MEIKLKYRVDDRNKSEEIWHDDYLASIEEEDSRNKVKMQSLYFDTEDFDLVKNDIALRVRYEGESKVVLTLKWNGRAEEGLHRREEINIPVSGFEAGKAPNLDIFLETEMGKDLLEIVKDKPLIKIMEANFLRRRFRVDTGDCICEVALDAGDIKTPKGDEPICELEIELFSGKEDDVFYIGSRLEERYELRKDNQSKFARGLKLLGII